MADAMADSITLSGPRPRLLPSVSFGPYALLEAVPWLMLASALRFLAYMKPLVALPAIMLASFSIFLAFLLAARRMIEFADGTTKLGTLTFADQLRLAKLILRHVVILLIGAAVAVAIVAPRSAIFMLAGFDGIAFDQFSKLGMFWSAMLAAIVLLMVVRAGDGGSVGLMSTLREFGSRGRFLLPAVVLLALILIVLSVIQGEVRGLLAVFVKTSAPQQVKNLVYFFFVFGFATLRLWVTLAMLVFALRESYCHAAA
jgi:hypothetical protein